MILVAGLTPAWQQIYLFDEFQTGEVNRARDVLQCASGKNLNVGFALQRLSGSDSSQVKVLSTAGGNAGLLLKQDFLKEKIETLWIETESQTRTCTTILNQKTHVTTELVENSLPMSEAELDQFLKQFHTEANKSSVVVLTGSLPNQTSPDYYSRLLETTSAKSVLDIRGEELKLALEHEPFLVKPNREELEQTTGEKLESDEQLIRAMRSLNAQGATWVLISNGPKEIWLTSSEQVFRFVPPKKKVINPIGCGDCLTAGIAWGIYQNQEDIPKAVCIGMAAAGLNLEQILPARIEADDVFQLADQIEYQELNSNFASS